MVHQNFPGQFKHLAPALVKQGHQVSALLLAQATPPPWQGVQQQSYWPGRGSSQTIHPWVADLETKVIRAQACLEAARKLAADGFSADVGFDPEFPGPAPSDEPCRIRLKTSTT